MGLGIYRVKPKVRIAKRISKGLAKLKPGERTKAYTSAGSRMAAGMVVDQYRGNQVEKVRNKMDTKFLARQERRAALKSQEHFQTGGAGTNEKRLDEYVMAIGKALLKPGAKVATKAAVAGTGRMSKIAKKMGITKLTGKVKGGKAGRFVAGKAHNVKVARRAQHIKNIRYARTKPFRAGAKRVAKTIGGETIVRSAVDVGSHAISNPGKTAIDKAMGATDSPYSNVNTIRAAQDQNSAAARGIPTRGAGPAHTKSNAQMAIRRTEMRTPPAMSARQPTRQRTNVSAGVIAVADNIFEKHYLDEVIGVVASVLAPQAKFVKNKIAKPISRAVTKSIRREGVDEVSPGLAYAVEFGHVRPMGKFSKKAGRSIINKIIAPGMEKMTKKKNQPEVNEILATTAIGVGAVGGLAARRLIKRNKINRKIYSKKSAKHTHKAQDFEARAKISGAVRSAGHSYTRKRLQVRGARLQRKINRLPEMKEGTLAGRAARHEIKSKQWGEWSKQFKKETKTAQTRPGKWLGKTRGKLSSYMEKGHKREAQRADTRLRAKGHTKQFRTIKQEKKLLRLGEGLLFTSPEKWQKKAQKQRVKASRAQATSDVFARRQRRGLERKLSRVQRKATRYGGDEKYGQNSKKKISGKSTAQIVAVELERRHNLYDYDEGTENTFNLAQYRLGEIHSPYDSHTAGLLNKRLKKLERGRKPGIIASLKPKSGTVMY
jgi:hypothetical protein